MKLTSIVKLIEDKIKEYYLEKQSFRNKYLIN